MGLEQTITSYDAYNPPIFMPPEPKGDGNLFPYQEPAAKDTLYKFAFGYDRGQLIVPCGFGKTVVAIYVAAALKARSIVVLVPTLDLVSQWGREFYRFYEKFSGRKFEPGILCSKDHVADGKSFPTSAKILRSTEELRTFLGGGDSNSTKIVFGTYQSSDRLVGVPFDFGIIDEAHNCVGDMKGLFKTVLDGQAVPIKRLLFMTATQKVISDRLRSRAPIGVTWVGMDDEDMFGPIFYRMGFGEAIKKDIICDYDFSIFEILEREIRRYHRELNLTRDGDLWKAGAILGMLKAIRQYKRQHIITFHNSVRAAELFSERLTDARRMLPRSQRPPGRFWSHAISGDTQVPERQRLLKLFESDGAVRVISNACVIREGVDLCSAQAVGIMEPKFSKINIVQAVSRALRKHEGKEKGLIIVPVFFRNGQSVNELLETSEFSVVWHVINAMAEQDERLRGELDALGARHLNGETVRLEDVPSRIHWDGAKVVGFNEVIGNKLVRRASHLSFGSAYPKLAKEWHPTKNNGRTPFDVRPRSGFKAWWVCYKNDKHEWQATVANRTKGSGCPYCCQGGRGSKFLREDSFGAKYPKLSQEWHPTKNNGRTPFDFSPGSNKKAWWACLKNKKHTWRTMVCNRTKKNNNGCPCCNGTRGVIRDDSFGVKFPKIARQWHPTKNKGTITPFNIRPGSGVKVWWVCDKNKKHQWQARVCSRTKRGAKCPYCTYRLVMRKESFGSQCPKLICEWHPTKNKSTPFDVIPLSKTKAWWVCNKKHQWQARVYSRTNGAKCPYCSRLERHQRSQLRHHPH